MLKHKYLLQLSHKQGAEEDRFITYYSVETNVSAVILDAESSGAVGWNWEVSGVTCHREG